MFCREVDPETEGNNLKKDGDSCKASHCPFCPGKPHKQ